MDDEIENIKRFVPQTISGISCLIVAEDEYKRPAAFLVVEGQKLEMLFVSPKERGKGLGKRLLQYGIESDSK